MATTNIFEQASRKKLRFKGSNGNLNTEDLWGLELPQLNSIAVGLHKQLETTSISFIDDTSKENKVAQLAFDVVKHVIDTKKEEQKKKDKRNERRQERTRLAEMLAKKQDEKLNSMSAEEIPAQLQALDEVEEEEEA